MGFQTRADWRQRVIDKLIEAGTVGIKQYELHTMVNVHIDAKGLLQYLKALEAEQKVQVFRVPSARGLSAHVWRATTKILEP